MLYNVNLETVYTGLGLDYEISSHMAHLIDTDAKHLYACVSDLLPQLALPLPQDEASSKILEPDYLDQEVQELFLRFKHIWSLASDRRACVTYLDADDLEDVVQ